MSESCRFCKIVNREIEGQENQPIWENNQYMAIASIGALVDGWVLIVPKKHLVSMKDVYNNEGFMFFTNSILNVMRQKYSGAFIAFEHGPNKCGSKTSCGTDHAHLHLVPHNSLYGNLIGTGLVWDKCNASQISSKAGTNEYLFYTDITTDSMWQDHKGYIHVLEQPFSQFFRRLIAQKINRADEYDYKKFAHVDVAIETRCNLSLITPNVRE